MIMFWIVAAAMLALTLAVLLPPLLGQGPGNGVKRQDLNLTIYRERVAELERDRAEGKLGDQEYQQALTELERELLNDSDPNAEEVSTSNGRRTLTAAVVAVALPVLAVLVYQQLGEQDALRAEPTPDAARNMMPKGHPGTEEGGQQMSLEDMVGNLAKRMETEPDNMQGWYMLGRSYQVMNRAQDALAAYEKALALAPENPDVLVRVAEVRAILQGGKLSGEPERLLERLLVIQPENANGLWLSGLAARERGDAKAALDHWQRLNELLPADEKKQLVPYLAQVRGELGLPVVSAAPAQNAETPADDQAGGGMAVQVKVSIEPDLTDKVSASDTVFIFARAAKGPRMPLAIVRKTVADLPVSVTLDDSMAMSPAMKLSNFTEIIVGARVSRTGNAMPQAGDLEGLSEAVPATKGAPVTITIDRQI